ncbi:MAG: hypothetical protein AAGF95_23390 [Chloroflexota bacterium]
MKKLFREPDRDPVLWVFLPLGIMLILLSSTVTGQYMSNAMVLVGLGFCTVVLAEMQPKQRIRFAVLMRCLGMLLTLISMLFVGLAVYNAIGL